MAIPNVSFPKGVTAEQRRWLGAPAKFDQSTIELYKLNSELFEAESAAGVVEFYDGGKLMKKRIGGFTEFPPYEFEDRNHNPEFDEWAEKNLPWARKAIN